jgi:hypothetical protein
MKIKATRHFLSDIGMVRRGTVVDMRDVLARQQIERGLAVAVEAEGEKTKKGSGRNGAGKPDPKPAPAPTE